TGRDPIGERSASESPFALTGVHELYSQARNRSSKCPQIRYENTTRSGVGAAVCGFTRGYTAAAYSASAQENRLGNQRAQRCGSHPQRPSEYTSQLDEQARDSACDPNSFMS